MVAVVVGCVGVRFQKHAENHWQQATAQHVRCSSTAIASRFTSVVHEGTSKYFRTGHYKSRERIHQSVFFYTFVLYVLPCCRQGGLVGSKTLLQQILQFLTWDAG